MNGTKVTKGTKATDVILVACLMMIAPAAMAQTQAADDSLVARPLATRAQLTELQQRLSAGDDRGGRADLLARVNMRLTTGDFRPNDRILLSVQGDTALSDTFVIGPDRTLRLPSPTTGTLNMAGVLRSELQDRLQAYVARFVNQPIVRARPLIRISIQGEVERAGYYTVPADALLGDAVMAAGGTTNNADLRKARVERGRDELLKGDDFQRAIATGLTIDEAQLRDGDQLIFPALKRGDVNNNLRFVGLLVSIAGGIYGLTRAFN